MAAARISPRLLDIGWCVLVPLGVVIVYLGPGVAMISVVGEPILGTALLDGVLVVLVAGVRLTRLRWITHAPVPRPMAQPQRFGWSVAGCAVLAFLAGQSLGLWLYVVGGSAGFDESVRARQDAGVALTFLLALVAAPIAEEMLFRGLLYPLLRRRVGVIPSVLVTSGVFGLLHGNVVQFATALPLAMLLALVYERTRRLWLCVFLHLGFNLAATFVPAAVLAGLANPVSALLLTTAFAGCALILYQKVIGGTVLADGVGDVAGDGEDERAEPRAA